MPSVKEIAWANTDMIMRIYKWETQQQQRQLKSTLHEGFFHTKNIAQPKQDSCFNYTLKKKVGGGGGGGGEER